MSMKTIGERRDGHIILKDAGAYRRSERRHYHLNSFMKYLREKTTLAELSIQLYARAIGNFKRSLKGKDNFTIQQVNKFLTHNYRDRRKPYVKYAFKYYFNYIHQEAKYKELIKVKSQSRKKKGHFLNAELVKKIIVHTKPKVYRDVARIQYATGCRGREVLTLHESDIDLFFEDGIIRIKIQGKGDKVRYTFLTREFEPLLRSYMGKGYLFLPKRMNYLEDKDLWRFNHMVSSFMTYYYNSLSNSALDFGIEGFGTHDLRRNAADAFRKKYKDVYLVKQILGHSSISITEKYFDDNPENIKDALVGHQREQNES